MTVLLQALTAFFAVVGLFEVAWQILLFFVRRSLHGKGTRILIKTDQTTDPAFLEEDLRILSNRLTACRDLQVWLICPKGAPQEEACRYAARHNEAIRMITPEDLPEKIQLFSEDL